jgi:hypothetical protein
MNKVYDNLVVLDRIDEVWEQYHKCKDKKKRAELRKEYRELAEADIKKAGWKRYQKI